MCSHETEQNHQQKQNNNNNFHTLRTTSLFCGQKVFKSSDFFIVQKLKYFSKLESKSQRKSSIRLMYFVYIKRMKSNTSLVFTCTQFFNYFEGIMKALKALWLLKVFWIARIGRLFSFNLI